MMRDDVLGQSGDNDDQKAHKKAHNSCVGLSSNLLFYIVFLVPLI